MAKVLVTGSAGFLGSFLVERLLKDGHHVVGIDNLFRGRRENLAHLEDDPRYEFVEGDLLDGPQLTGEVLSSGIDIVYHLAAINGTRHFYERPFDVLRSTIEPTMNVLRAIEQHPVQKLVIASSSEVYGEPMSVPITEDHPFVLDGIDNPRHSYAAGKVMSEYYTRWTADKVGFEWVACRIFNSYGPRMDSSKFGQVVPEFIERILSDEPFTLHAPGTQTRSFCFVEETVEYLVRCGDVVKNESLNIGNDHEITMLELAETLHDIIGKPFEYSFVEGFQGDIMRRVPDISRVKKLTGYAPQVELKEGLSKTVDWYRKARKTSIA